MVNEEIVGGLVSALSRGDHLQKGMMSFYNAGYNKEEIEDAAREVYRQLGPEAMGVKEGTLQQTFDEVAVKAGVVTKDASKDAKNPMASKIEIQRATPKKESETTNLNKENKSPQYVSGYGQTQYSGTYKDAEKITDEIEKAIKGLKGINIPSRIEIVNKSVDLKTPTVVQKVSDYSGGPPKPAGKVITYILIFILILLLGALAAVFFFKEELIRLFNNLGLG
jgi:hypothetical protein